METGVYKSISVINISKLFQGFQAQREHFMIRIKWDGSACDRALIAPERFEEEFMDIVATSVDVANIGPWNILHDKIKEVVKRDQAKLLGGLQVDYYIDIEN